MINKKIIYIKNKLKFYIFVFNISKLNYNYFILFFLKFNYNFLIDKIIYKL